MSETASAIAADIRSGQRRAVDVVGAALARIAERDTAINAVTAVVGEQALADAARVDAKIARGEEVGPLAGVPFAVKNLFDVAGLTTLAGSKVLQDASPAVSDASYRSRLGKKCWPGSPVVPLELHTALSALAG